MKTLIISLFFTLLFCNGFTQDLNFSVQGKYAHPITMEKIIKARSMSDIIPYYPSSWIDSYISSEISVISNGIPYTASSSNDILSEDQLMMLGSLDFGDEIVINIRYKRENTFNIETGNGHMHYSATLVPDTEAQYSEGYDQLSQYIKRNAIVKISEDESKDMQQTVVRFAVNEKGEITDALISKSSGNAGIDKILLDVINEMPDWNPASDSQGIMVRQEFEFTVWGGGEGC